MSDAEAFDTQLAYLLERSAFYRAKGIERVPLQQIASLPLTDKAEIRATITAEHPFGTHFAADESETVRALVAWKASLADEEQPALV